MRIKQTWVLILCIAVIAAGVLGCGSEQERETKVVIAQGVDARTMDPHMHAETTTTNVLIHIFDRLFTRDEDMELIPHLAEEAKVMDDLIWEITLKEGIYFHNGESFNADSVKFSIDRIIKPGSKSPVVSSLNTIDQVEVIDDVTVRIITKVPDPILPNRLTLMMVPKEYILKHGDEYFAEHPVGTGPYELASWTRDEEVVLQANEEYWLGPPAIETVVFRSIPENSVRIAELQTGSVDLIVNVPPHQIGSVEETGHSRVVSTPSGRRIYVQLVADQGGKIADPKVRQALNYAVDVPELIETILDGHGYASTQPLTPLDFGYHPEAEGFSYDPKRAQELLTEAGYPEGISIQLDTCSGRYVMDREVAEALIGQMAEAGIEAELTVNEWGVHIEKLLEKQMEHAFLIGVGTVLFDADAALFSHLRSEERLSYYSNEELDGLLDQARQEMDLEARENFYHQAIEVILEDPPFIFLHQQEDIYGVHEDLQWQPTADELIYAYHMSFNR